MTTKLERISLRAKKDRECVFNNLGHVLDVDLLREQYYQLDGRKAVGMDGVTKGSYGVHLEENLSSLIERMRKGAYKPQAAKVVEIPKEDGSSRGLAIACFEDKIVQAAVSAILTVIYEPTFLPSSYGFRPTQNCHDALRVLAQHTYQNKDGAVVEIDIQQYYNSIPWDKLEGVLREKITDKRFLSILKVLMRTPMLKDGHEAFQSKGCPQGSIVSPIFSNIYLHRVIDKWFEESVCTHIEGQAAQVRYADGTPVQA